MKLVINQKPSDFERELSVQDLLIQLKLNGKPVAIEVNQDLVPSEDHSKKILVDGDQIEIVTLAGGG